MNMQIHELEMDNSVDNYDETKIQARNNILEAFENFENEYLRCINENKESTLYNYFYNEVEFKEKNMNNKRFCSFCLLKKVFYYM
jgi:hypothetical protein